jgi:peptidoglycan/xylan/chitin deacetylase (PgdA/CDA1 family)
MAAGESLIVMYHYIWPDDRPVPGGIRPLLASEFERQLDWLAERYEIVSSERFLQTYREPGGRPPCLLTFDDGTRDHAEVATPILAMRALSGLFFITTGPAEEGIMPLTHALHWLLGQDEQAAWEALVAYAQAHLGGVGALDPREQALKIYHYETPLRARIKYAANMALQAEQTQLVIESLVAAAGESMTSLARQWFTSREHWLVMQAMGMELGMHGVTHRSLQSLGAEGISREIAECANALRWFGGPPTWWACPFGGSGADEVTIAAMNQALAEQGVKAAVTTRSAYVSRADDPMALPRIDCIHLPPRAS